tara:strand:+ start:10424 stop:11377 length:954 start_codon:yes stop_codon:yes gene_type:complete
MKTKFAIGCLVQWYECDIIEEYVESLKDAIKNYDGEVITDFTIITNEDLEKCISAEKKNECIEKIGSILLDFENVRFNNNLYTIADYRREFNETYCDKVDVIMWGESDALIPNQTFIVLDNLHQTSLQNKNTKYLAFFGTCKMWDSSWKQLEHPDFTDKPFYDKPEQFKPNHWWSLRYTMSKKEMDIINNKTEELDIRILSQHKFNGCGLVISSEVIRSGVNIPKSVFFTHEDTSLMFMTNKVLGNIPQYVIKNILLVHNRKHNDKRRYVRGETGDTMQSQRESNNWYSKAHSMSEKNCYNIFNPNYKPYTWDDVRN